MEPSKCLLLLAISISLFVFSVIGTVGGQNYLCYDQDGNFMSNETYGTTLDTLLESIATTNSSTLRYGLFNVSSSRPMYPDNIQVLGVCGGDVTPEDCRDCLNATAQQVRRLCPAMKKATLFTDMCWIRYSGSQMYGVVEIEPYVRMGTAQDASNWDRIKVGLKKLLDHLRDEAASGGSIRKYATGNISVDLSTLYGMVQCSLDLNDQLCSDCIVGITGRLPQGKLGAMISAPSCQLRFETYRFFNSVAVPLPSPPPPPPRVTTLHPPPPPIPSGKTNSSRTWLIVSASSGGSVVIAIVILVLVIARRKSTCRRPRSKLGVSFHNSIGSAESLQFNLDVIRAATGNFSDDNKLGKGGFGFVFRGTLPGGQQIAVKRLSENSGQGEMEFKNEVRLLARLQHRNLVRLLGFCLEGIEKLLIYEFVPNASLDKFIFDPVKRALLDWDARYKIITGVARGLLYLHEDSRLRIIHRDLKASNILLDADMNAKVSDFGMARLFEFDQIRAETNRIMGTYGYMAPEYILRGHFSIKSDVFSFGVLVLEILSGRRNLVPRSGEDYEILLSHAWTNWREGRISNVIDPTVRSCYNTNIARCIHIGLLCVQENMKNRPTMAAVVLMLNSQSVTLPVPTPPAFLMNTSSAIDDISSVLDTTSTETKHDFSANDTATFSINEASITEPYPR